MGFDFYKLCEKALDGIEILVNKAYDKYNQYVNTTTTIKDANEKIGDSDAEKYSSEVAYSKGVSKKYLLQLFPEYELKGTFNTGRFTDDFLKSNISRNHIIEVLLGTDNCIEYLFGIDLNDIRCVCETITILKSYGIVLESSDVLTERNLYLKILEDLESLNLSDNDIHTLYNTLSKLQHS